MSIGMAAGDKLFAARAFPIKPRIKNMKACLSVVPLLSLLATPAIAFEFVHPAGWRDLSRNAPVTNFSGIPQDVTVQAVRGNYASYAVDPTPGTGGFYANFSARVLPGGNRISDKFLEGFVHTASAALEQEGLRYQVNERNIETLEGVRVGRIVADLTDGDAAVRQLVYVLPGAKETAALVYTAAMDDFERYRPEFERAARATKGIAERSLVHWLFTSDQGHYLLGQITGVTVGVGLAMGIVFAFRARRG